MRPELPAARLLASDSPQGIVEDLCGKVMEYLDCQVSFNYLVVLSPSSGAAKPGAVRSARSKALMFPTCAPRNSVWRLPVSASGWSAQPAVRQARICISKFA
jgi:hypothetical protein